MSTWSARSNMQSAPRSISRFSIRRPFRSCAKAPCRAAETTFAGISLEDTAACCLQGTVRKVNEDRWAIQVRIELMRPVLREISRVSKRLCVPVGPLDPPAFHRFCVSCDAHPRVTIRIGGVSMLLYSKKCALLSARWS